MDLRVRKTIDAIRNTFKKMVLEMDANKITVKELAERAKIHRKTFYLHYESIESLFEEMIEIATNAYFNEIDKVPLPMPMKEINRVFFTYMVKQDSFTERLVCTESYRDFSNRIFNAALKHNRKRYNPYMHLPEAEQNIVNTFTAESTLDMYRRWVKDGKKIPVDRLIELTGMLLSSGTQSITNI
jgi:AcrR family transcriptional regulator